MHSSHDHPHREEASSTHDPPQVVVRAGKTYLCSACGTLIEIPADVVGQYVLVPASTETADQGTADEEAACKEAAEKRPPERQATGGRSTSPSTTSGNRTGTKSQATISQETEKRLPRPDRPKRPRRPRFAHQQIDGLRVPSSGELDRAFHWVSYQLKVLDRNESEIRRLKKLLKQSAQAPTPRRRPVRPVREVPVDNRQRHAHEDVGMAPEIHVPGATHAQERAPP